MNGVVDYLLSLRTKSGEPLARNRSYQVIIPNFPSLTIFDYTIAPGQAGNYYLIYGYQLAPEMVPHAFDIKVSAKGDKFLDIVSSGIFSNMVVNTLDIISQATPITVRSGNLTMLNQYYELTAFYLSIASEQNYLDILNALDRINNAGKLESLVGQTNEILRAIGTGQPAGVLTIRPPITR